MEFSYYIDTIGDNKGTLFGEMTDILFYGIWLFHGWMQINSPPSPLFESHNQYMMHILQLESL